MVESRFLILMKLLNQLRNQQIKLCAIYHKTLLYSLSIYVKKKNGDQFVLFSSLRMVVKITIFDKQWRGDRGSNPTETGHPDKGFWRFSPLSSTRRVPGWYITIENNTVSFTISIFGSRTGQGRSRPRPGMANRRHATRRVLLCGPRYGKSYIK